MHENEFEKQVQKKMEELQFAPSDAVWKNVDKEINQKEKRRRPVFWLFFFLGLMLLGGGGYYLLSNNREKKVERLSRLNELKDEKKVEELNGLKGDEKVEKLNELKEDKKVGDLDGSKEDDKVERVEGLNGLKADKKVEKLSGLNDLKKKIVIHNNKTGSSIAKKVSKSKSFDERKRNIDIKENELSENGSKNSNEENGISKNSTEGNIITKEAKKNVQDSSVDKTETIVPENKKNIPADNKTVLSDSSTDKKIAKSNPNSKKSSHWKIGFNIAPGISSVKRGLFSTALNVNAASSPSLPVTGGPTSAYSSPSEIKSGFSFDVGVSISKSISKRLLFSTGLNYHYYSTNITIGKFVDSGTNVFSSYNNSSLTSQVNGYYVSGSNKYINSYHFLELPLSLGLQLNKSQKNPLIWEAGLSVSYLINSNALNFDTIKNVYYKNRDLFNKTQLNAATSLMVGFHIHKNEMQIGPQLQYGLSKLLNKSTGNDEHSFFAGIKFSYILNKK